ncbi:MAG: transporter [Bacteroidetes bacterium]|nr:MAG: transporter [Bacteroidota bacterium]
MNLPSFRFNGRKSPLPASSDPGFGTKITSSSQRLINKDGSFNIVREGQEVWTIYQQMLEMSWTKFFAWIVLYYLAVNFVFAIGFVLLGVDKLAGLTAGGLLDNLAQGFFFSIQTFTTVGYGAIHPQGIPANLLASLDALVGLISTALATGLFFARFSKAQAQLVFSKDALIAPYHDTEFQSFQFRIANLRDSKIINLRASAILSWVEERAGMPLRRFFNLPLERDQVNVLPLSWTIVHIIDDESPIKGWEPKDFTARQAEVMIFLEGFDESFGQRVHVISSYTCQEIRWNAQFQPMYYPGTEKTILNLDAIHEFSFLD